MHADKTSQNNNQAEAISLPKLQSSGDAVQVVDNRPEAIAQRNLKKAVNNSAQVQQWKAYQAMANNSPQVKQLQAYQAMADNSSSKTVQGKFIQPPVHTAVIQPKAISTTIPLQKAEVEASKREDKDFGKLGELKLAELSAYTQTQADWHIGLKQDEFEFIFEILKFAQADKNLGVYGQFKISDFNDYKGIIYKDLPDLLQKLTIAQKETNQATTGFEQPIQEPAIFESLPVFFKAIEELERFYKAVPKHIQKTMLGDVFAVMNMDGTLPFFYDYCNLKPTPIFESRSDSYSFSKNAKEYLGYAQQSLLSKLRLVQNFHRFDPGVLQILETNAGDTSRKKPLTLIMYTSHDDQGSFVRKDSLPAVVSDTNCLTILIEGMGSLSNYADASTFAAKEYGRDGKISQVLICGHGSSKEVALSDDPQGRLSVKGNNKKPTLQFFEHLIGLMYTNKVYSGFGSDVVSFFTKTPKTTAVQRLSRIVFSACEVNAVVLPENSEEIDKAGGLEDFFKKNKNLVQTFIDVVGEGEHAYPKIMGANASIRAKGQTLIKGSGELDLVSNEDPSLTASKLEYVEKGTMVDGVIRAFVYCLSLNKKATVEAVEKRLKTKPKALVDVFIHAHFAFIKQKGYEAYDILNDESKATGVYTKFRTLESGQEFPFKLAAIDLCFDNKDHSTFYGYTFPLFADIKYDGKPAVELVLAQIDCYLQKNTGWILKVLSHMTAQDAAPYLSWDILNLVLPSMLKDPDPAVLKLAICGLAKNNSECQNFLQQFVVQEPKEQFDPKIELVLVQCINGFTAISSIPALLNKVTGKEEALALDFHIAFDEKKKANLTPNGSVDNTVFVRPNFKNGVFNKPEVELNRLPEAAVISKDEKGGNEVKQYVPALLEKVYITGETEQFWAINHASEKHAVFVKKGDITAD